MTENLVEVRGVPAPPVEPAGNAVTPLRPLVLVGLLAGPFMSMMDSSVVNVALPAIARGLHVDLAAAQWVISGYLLAFALGLPGVAFLAKRLGTRAVYMASLAGFTLASLSCVLAPSLPVLVGLRALQGLCGSPLVPLAMNVLLDPAGGERPAIPPVAGVLLFLAPALAATLLEERAASQLRRLLAGAPLLPASLPRLLREASLAGLHDTILALALVAALAAAASLFLPSPTPASATGTGGSVGGP